MWVRNAWYVAAWSHEIEPGRIAARTIIDQPLVLYRTQSGEVVVLEDRCCHRFAPLFYRLDEQAVTPMTERTSRYFYAAGARADDINDDRVDRLFDVTKAAFHEDKTIIEAQQKTIDLDPGRPMLPTSLDAGPTRFRKMVEAMVTEGDR